MKRPLLIVALFYGGGILVANFLPIGFPPLALLLVGALVALHDVHAAHDLGPLGHAMQERASRLGTAFRRVVFSQVRISAINTALSSSRSRSSASTSRWPRRWSS